MSSNVQVCVLDAGLSDRLKAFRFNKSEHNRALILKVDPVRKVVVADGDEHENIDIDELRDELPERQPRFVVLTYKWEHSDGRLSYPLCLLFSTPQDCKMELQMMYAGSKLSLVKEAGITKVFEFRDLEDFTEEWLVEQLQIRK